MVGKKATLLNGAEIDELHRRCRDAGRRRPAKVIGELTDDDVQSALDNSRVYVQKIDSSYSLERMEPVPS